MQQETSVFTYRNVVGMREPLTANRTYYVRTDGDDGNDGLTNSSGGAFATIQKAIDVIGGLDLGIQDVTIQLGDTGTFAGFTVSAPFVGGPGSSVTVLGNTGSPGSYVINSTILANNFAVVNVSGLDFTHNGNGIRAINGAVINMTGACIFGTNTGGVGISAYQQGIVAILADYTVDGNQFIHAQAAFGGVITYYDLSADTGGITVTLSGTPAASLWWFGVLAASVRISVSGDATTFSGSGTGKRFISNLNGVLDTDTGTPDSFLPGDSSGTTATGGVAN